MNCDFIDSLSEEQLEQLKQLINEKQKCNSMKYRLTENTKMLGNFKLFQIQRTSDGKLGGWVESEKNLSQEGNCWVFDDAIIYGNALVCGNAQVLDNAKVYGNAKISDNALVYNTAQVCGDARVSGSAQVYGDAKVYGDAWVSGNARVYGGFIS